MSSVAEAFVSVRPDLSKFSGDLKSKLPGMAKVAGVAFAAVGAAAVGAAVKGVRAFADFERGMNEVFTLLPGITQDAMDDMTSEVRQFSREFGVLPDEVVPALYQALSAGVPQDNVFEFLAIATKASIGGVTDMETAVNGITSVVNNYGEDIIDAQKASDLMFTTVRLGKTDFEQLSASVGNILPFAVAAGVSFEDISAAMANMTAKTGKTAESSTQLRALLVELADGGSSVAESFSEVAGVTFPEFISSGGNMADAMAILEEAAANSNVTVDQLFGSVEAGAGALLLSGENLEGFRENLDEMTGSAGATDEAFKTMDQGLARSWENIKVKLNDLFIELGERIAPALQRFADWFEEQMPAILTWFERTAERAGEMGQAIWRFWTEDAKPALDEFVGAVQENWPLVESMFDSLGRVMRALGDIFSKETASWSGDTSDATRSMEDDVTSVMETLERFLAMTARVTEVVSGAWNLIAGGIKGNGAQIIRGLDDVSGGAFGRFMDRAQSLRDSVAAVFSAMARHVRERLGDVVQFFRELPARIKSAIGSAGTLLTAIGKDMIRGLINGIKGMAGDAARAARDAVKGAVDSARSFLRISSPSKVFMEIGEQSGQGLIEGLEHMLREVADAGTGLGAAAVPDVGSMRAPAMVGAGAGGPATFHLYDSDGALMGTMRGVADTSYRTNSTQQLRHQAHQTQAM